MAVSRAKKIGAALGVAAAGLVGYLTMRYHAPPDLPHNPGVYIHYEHLGDGVYSGRRIYYVGDIDFDGDCDGVDHTTLARCYNGSLKPPVSGCVPDHRYKLCDMDLDGDVDGKDFLTMSLCTNGSLRPPGCKDPREGQVVIVMYGEVTPVYDKDGNVSEYLTKEGVEPGMRGEWK